MEYIEKNDVVALIKMFLATSHIRNIDDEEVEIRIKSFPTEAVKPIVQARWRAERRGLSEGGYYFRFYCTHCNNTSIRKYPYCPHCGAYMINGNGEEK